MLNLNSIMIGTSDIKKMSEFYEKIFERKPDMIDDEWHGWQVGGTFFGVGKHSDINGLSSESNRIIFNFETKDVNGEFERIKKIGAKVIKEPYQINSLWIATFSDPDENYFQLMSPWQ